MLKHKTHKPKVILVVVRVTPDDPFWSGCWNNCRTPLGCLLPQGKAFLYRPAGMTPAGASTWQKH